MARRAEILVHWDGKALSPVGWTDRDALAAHPPGTKFSLKMWEEGSQAARAFISQFIEVAAENSGGFIAAERLKGLIKETFGWITGERVETDGSRAYTYKSIGKMTRVELAKFMRALKSAKGDDPSLGMRNKAPPPRWQTYTEGEATILVKRAIRAKQYELACIIAVTWDTLFSPGDVRLLVGKHVAYRGKGSIKNLFFDRTEDGRIKTGRAAIGTVGPRTQRLCEEVWKWRGVEHMPDAYIWRKADGKPFKDHELAKAFSAIRDEGDSRQLRDMRRSGSGEANASGVSNPGLLSAKLANSIQTSNALHKTYSPVDHDAVIEFDKARLAGRQKRRAGNE